MTILKQTRSSDKKEKSATTAEDITGQKKIVINVLFSWGSYIVFFVAGFIMPRMIDNYIGQRSLGVWDFCWSFINYLNLTSLGVGSSVSRYIATYRAQNNIEDLRKTISSVVCIQIILAFLILAITAMITTALPVFFSARLGAETVEAQWVVSLLGTSYAVQTAFDISRGVLTGYHCWGLFNGIMSVSRAVTVAGMAVALIMGGGLRSLATVYLVVMAATEFVRMSFAMRVCDELKLRLKYINWDTVKKMTSFGSRTVLAELSSIVIIQTSNIFILSSLGPAALAVFSRPMALVRHIQAFQNKFAYVLTPTVGSLYGTGRTEELRAFFIEYARYGVAISLPFFIFLSVLGENILSLWMGPDYIDLSVLVFLCAGYFLPVSQSVAMRVLIGINAHGKAAFWSLIISVTVFTTGVIAIRANGWTLSFTAILVGLSLTCGQGVFVPAACCYKLKISALEYIRSVFPAPLFCGVGFAASLLLTRSYFEGQDLYAILLGIFTGGAVLGVLYWFFILKAQHRDVIISFLKNYLSRN